MTGGEIIVPFLHRPETAVSKGKADLAPTFHEKASYCHVYNEKSEN
jgi:hypothetical protein